MSSLRLVIVRAAGAEIRDGLADEFVFFADFIAVRVAGNGIAHDEIHIVFPASPWRVDARFRRAASTAGGNVRPRFCARRKIPAAAFGLKKYLLDTAFCRTADKEHATAALRDSEILAVQHAVADHRPAFPKPFKDRGQVPSAVRAKQPWDIFNEPPPRFERVRDADEFMEEAGAFAAEAGALPGDRQILAGESATEKIERFIPVARPLPHVIPADNVWPSRRKHSPGERVSLNLPRNLESCSFQSKVKPSHP